MIHNALEFLTDELNSYLKIKNRKTNMSENMVTLTNVATQEGNWAIPNNKLGISLINIEEERVFKEQRATHVTVNGESEHYNPEIKLNLYVLITSNYTSGEINADSTEYLEGLKQLSNVIAFFQQKSVFNTTNSPSLDPAIGKLVVELFSYSFEQLYNFWTVIGAKYLPSVLYKVRLMRIQEKEILGKQPVLSGLDITN
ncbi:MAG: DUF4255 domain-containing protein [Cyclobacteriaceae bacterium]